MLYLVFEKHRSCIFAYFLIASEPSKSIKFRQPKDMEKEKVIQIAAEAALMSLAHDILRNRNRMDLEQIQEKAQAIVALSKTENIPVPPVPQARENPSSPLEEMLLAPVEEATFETISSSFTAQLFEGNDTDYKRVMSVLRSKETLDEATAFIDSMVKPDYDWSNKEDEVAAFIAHISKNYSA